MTLKITVCLIALSVGLIELLRGDYMGALVALVTGVIFLINILRDIGEIEPDNYKANNDWDGNYQNEEDDSDDDNF